MKRLIRDIIRGGQWYPLRWLVNALSRRQVVALGNIIGSLQYALPRKKSAIARNELLKCLPDLADTDDIDTIIRRSYCEACSVYLETFCFPRITPDTVDQWMRLHGQDHLNQALRKGNGAMLVLVHYGANQMVMAALGHRNYTINQIGSRPDDWHRLSGIEPTPMERRIFDLRLKLEQSLPANFIYIDRSMRPVYNCLRDNEIMMLACDGRAGARFLQTTVCHRTMNVSAGPFRIAAATGAPLIPVFPVRNDDGIHDLYIEPPIRFEASIRDKMWPEKAAEVYGQRLTEWITVRPDHYLMLMTEAALRSRIDSVPLFEDYKNGS